MMAFRGRSRKPEEDMQLFAYNLEALLSRAMPNIEAGDRNTLLKQQFIEGVATTLKKELLQRPNLSYEDTVSIAQQLDLASHISSKVKSITPPQITPYHRLINRLLSRS